MTVKELINELKTLPENVNVYLVGDWGQTDENGYLTDLKKVIGVSHQIVAIDDGLDFHDESEILLETEA